MHELSYPPEQMNLACQQCLVLCFVPRRQHFRPSDDPHPHLLFILQAPPGVDLSVSGTPVDGDAGGVHFNNSAKGGDGSGSSTDFSLPVGGMSGFTFEVFVPSDVASTTGGGSVSVSLQRVFNPPSPPPPPPAFCPCDAMPESADGACATGKFALRFGLAGGEQNHTRCFPGFTVQSPSILSFFYCINYACLPPSFQNQTLDVTAEKVLVPGGPTSFAGNRTATLVVFLVPSCATPSASAFKYNLDDELTELPTVPGQNGVFKYPMEGIAALSLHARISPECDDNYVSGMITSAYVQEDQLPVPTSSCPCWSTPQEAIDPNDLGCDGIKIPVTLETVPNWRFNDGVSYQQCIDPANFDFL